MTEEIKIPAKILIGIVVITIIAGIMLSMLLNLFLGRNICKFLGGMFIETFFSGGPIDIGLTTGIGHAGANVFCDWLPF